jgi:excisionase family DNA binding protein
MTTEAPMAYRPEEAGRMLGISREMVFKLIRQGELKAFKVGAATVIRAEELRRYLDEQEARAE